MSGNNETPQMKSRNKIRRTAPSTRLKMICPPSAGFAFFSSVAANRGRYLYMKMKKASEMMTLAAASQPLRAAAFTRVSFLGGEDMIDAARMDCASPRCGGG